MLHLSSTVTAACTPVKHNLRTMIKETSHMANCYRRTTIMQTQAQRTQFKACMSTVMGQSPQNWTRPATVTAPQAENCWRRKSFYPGSKLSKRLEPEPGNRTRIS